MWQQTSQTCRRLSLLFNERDEAIGKRIRINGYRFTVIGVQEYVEDLFGISENDYLYIPMPTFDQYIRAQKEYACWYLHRRV